MIRADMARMQFAVARMLARRTSRPPKKTRGIPKSDPARTAEMQKMRLAGETFKEIGAKYDLTRERVRQLLHSMPRQKKPDPWPRIYFHKTMKRWLWDAGYHRCSTCQLWRDDLSHVRRRCRPCAAAYANVIYHEKGGREYNRTWRSLNPDKSAANTKRWQEKNREKVTAKARASYQKLVSTPEGREKVRQYWRDSYARRRAENEQEPPTEPDTLRNLGMSERDFR